MRTIELHEANGGRLSMHCPETFTNIIDLGYARLVMIRSSDDIPMTLKVSETYDELTTAMRDAQGVTAHAVVPKIAVPAKRVEGKAV